MRVLHTGPMVKILQILVLIEQINKYSQKKKNQEAQKCRNDEHRWPPRIGGILGWADSSRKPTRKATYGLAGIAPQSSMAEPVN